MKHNTWQLLVRLLRTFAKCKIKIIYVMLCILIIMLSNFTLPFLTRSLIDDGFKNTNIKLIILIALSLLGIQVIITLFEFLKEYFRISIYNDVYSKLNNDALNHFMNIRINYFHDKTSSEICNALDEDITTLSAIADDETFETITDLFSAIGGSVALFYIDWRLGMAVLCFMPIQYVSNIFLANMNIKIATKYNITTQKYNSELGSTIDGMLDIRFLGIKDKRLKIMKDYLSDVLKLNIRKNLLLKGVIQFQYLLTEIVVAGLYILSAFLMIRSNLTIGSIIAFQTFALMMINPFCRAIEFIFNVSSIVPSLERYYKFMDEKEEPHCGLPITHLEKTGSIVFSDVTFFYNEKNKILEHLNFVIPYGSKVAITGINGAGKTTIINLLLRVIEPISGIIKIDDTMISKFNLEEYRKIFAVVTQNPYLFKMTLKENICISGNSKDLSNVIAQLGFNKFFDEKGMNYNLGNNGAMLSGGQRQKVVLARMLMQDRPYVILDEADSHLDVETVKLLYSLFKTELASKTVICITHGNITNKNFDIIVNVGQK